MKDFDFDRFNLSENIIKGVRDAGFKKPSPIQEEAIPRILERKDLIAQAHTGTGKTAAFGLASLNIIEQENLQMLVITPTRELAMQVSDELYKLGRYANIKTVTIYGGQSSRRQVEFIKNGANVAVATVGRLLDLLSNNALSTFNPEIVVLDEADEMLDMGFLDDIKEIFTYLPTNRQTLLFSATMPYQISNLAKTILNEPEHIQITKSETTNENIEQYYYVVQEQERDNAIVRLIDAKEPEKSILFCRTKKEVDRLSTMLLARGFLAKGLHGDMEQNKRGEVIRAFKNKSIDILVATDVAARGLDIADVTHVFNYHIPFNPESYVHRIGRTGRAGKKGIAITLVTPIEFREIKRIQKVIKKDIEFCTIPSLDDVKKNQVVKIVKEIENQKVSEEAIAILKELENDLDNEVIAFKLISMLLEKQSISGPNKIGIDQKGLKSIIHSRSDDRGGRNRNYRGRGRHGGGNRRHGGGGGGSRHGGGGNRNRYGGSGGGGRRD